VGAARSGGKRKRLRPYFCASGSALPPIVNAFS
jgi:hypothetical protein